MKMFNRKGNSYIEIMVVVAVLLIITLFAIPRYQDLRRDAYRAQIANDSRLVEAYIIENYFYNGGMPTGSQVVGNSELKALVDSKKSYLRGDIISSTDIDAIGGEKHILDKEEVLKHVNTKLKGDFIYTDRGVIYVDNAKGSNSTEKPVDQTDLIKEIEDKIERLATTENKDKGYDLMDSIPKHIDRIIDKGEQDRLTKDYEDALEEFLSKFLGKIKQVSLGGHHSAAITENGDLYTWGSNYEGQRGHGDTDNRAIPTKVNGISNVKQVSLGYDYSAAITEDGDLYTWGRDIYGELGHGDEIDKSIPTKVKGISNVKQIALVWLHSAAITEDGDLYTWGNNNSGQLGHGDNDNRNEPTKVEYFKNKGLKVKQVSLGDSHSAAITEDGDLYTWGYGFDGQLGHGDNDDKDIPTRVKGISNVKQVALGYSHSAAITADGSLYTWGKNNFSQLGHGDEKDQLSPKKVEDLSNVKQVSLGRSCSAAITADGGLYTWGINYNDQLGHGDEKDQLSPKKVEKLTNVKQVSLGYDHSAAITEDGDLYTWGFGSYGRLGHGDNDKRNEPTKVEYFYNLRNK